MEDLSYELTLEKSFALVQSGDYEAAIAAWEGFISQNQSHGLAYFNLASLQETADPQNLKSISNFARACQLLPDVAEFRLEYASKLQAIGRYAEAVAECEHAILLAPDSIDGYQRRGLAQYFDKNYDESQSDFAKVLEIDPNNGFAHLRRAINFADSSELVESFEEISQFDSKISKPEQIPVSELGTLRSNACVHLAGYCIEAQNLDLADKVLSCLANGPVTPEDFVVGFILFETHFDFERAMKFFRQGAENSISIDGDTAFAISTRATAAGRSQATISILETAIEADPNHAICLQEAGWWHFQTGNLVAAERTLRHASTVLANDASPLLLLAWVLASKDDEASHLEAVDISHKMMALRGAEEHKKLKVLAKCQIVVGKVDEAKSNIEKVLELSPTEDISELSLLLKAKP